MSLKSSSSKRLWICYFGRVDDPDVENQKLLFRTDFIISNLSSCSTHEIWMQQQLEVIEIQKK